MPVSYVHHFFIRHGVGETEAQMHTDNCGAQNKNNPFIWYYLWPVMTGLHHSIEYHFLIAGHTKFRHPTTSQHQMNILVELWE